MAAHLVILGERNAIAWVLSNRQMAFTSERANAAMGAIQKGDKVFLYATRGAFHNPTRHRGRVFGTARAASVVTPRWQPIEIIGRSFSHDLSLDLQALAPVH